MSSGEPRGLARVIARLIQLVLDHRRAAALGLVVLVVVALAGLVRLQIDFSSTSFYGDESEAAARLARYHERWGPDDAALLILVEPVAADDPVGVLAEDRLEAIAALERALAATPEVLAARSIATLELPRPGLRGEPQPIAFPALVTSQGLATREPKGRAEFLSGLPIVPGLLSVEGESTVIVVELGFSSDDVLRTRAEVSALDEVLSSHDDALAAVSLRASLAGVPAIRAGFVDLVIRDQLRFVPLTLLVIGLSLGLSFRSIHGVLIPATAAAVPTVVLVGVMAWSGQSIGLLNQVYFTLLPIIAVADAVHMLARYHEARAEIGGEPGAGGQRQAIVTAGSRVGLACLLTSLTTGAGFASLATAKMPILRSFGLYAALGVGLAFVTVIVVVPLLLSVLDDDPSPKPLPGSRLVDAVLGLALRRPGACLIAGLGLCGLALIPARAVVIDNHLSDLLDADHPTSHASARIDEVHSGVLGLEVEIEVEPGTPLDDPRLLEAVEGFEAWFVEQPEVREVSGLASLIAASGRLTREPTQVPATRAEVRARLDRISPYVDLGTLVATDDRVLRIHAGVPDIGGRAFVDLAERAEAELDIRLIGHHASAHVTSTALLAYRGVNGITADLRRSFALVFAVVTLVMVALFRSGWPALIALLPNAGPLILGYASLGVFGIVLDPLAAVILTLGLGIAVDDSLHIMVRTREELAAGHELDEALRRSIGHSGRAVTVTTLILVAGLGLNVFASFPALVLLGLLGAVVLGLALVFDLLVLPATIVLIRGRGLR